MRPLVVGVGNRWRGDDGVGPRVLDRLATDPAVSPGEVDLIELDGEATRLLDTMDHRDLVVVVDAVRCGAVPGTVHHFDVTDDRLPVPGGVSSHAGGVAHAVGLAAALGRMPGRVVIVGVEIGEVDHTAELSAPVAAAVAVAAAAVISELRRDVPG